MIIFTLPMQVRQVAVANWIDGFIQEKIGDHVKRNWQDLIAWIILTVACSGIALPLAFLHWQTALVAFLLYLPLTVGIIWLTVYRNKLWFGLWFLVFWGWITFVSPYVFEYLLESFNEIGFECANCE